MVTRNSGANAPNPYNFALQSSAGFSDIETLHEFEKIKNVRLHNFSVISFKPSHSLIPFLILQKESCARPGLLHLLMRFHCNFPSVYLAELLLVGVLANCHSH